MVERYFASPKALRKFEFGPFGSLAGSFAKRLEQEGYSWGSVRIKLRQVRSFNDWVRVRHLGVDELVDGSAVEGWLRALRRPGRCCRGERQTLRQLVALIRDENPDAVVAKSKPAPGPHEQLLGEFMAFLLEERGITALTASRYVGYARRLLTSRRNDEGSASHEVVLSDIVALLLDVERSTPGQVSFIATALRGFVRFLQTSGHLGRDITEGLPPVMRWRLARLPARLSHHEVDQLLEAQDRETDLGKRNYALLLLLARLGLRASEVARLTLDDVDWQAGTLLVRGKSKRSDRLPLPSDVGEALVDYLQSVRTSSRLRHIFLTLNAPRDSISRRGVSNIVRRALKAAGLRDQGGAHLLRHSLASELLHQGASLAEVGQVLRHQNTATTEIYAKVRTETLRELALPWPLVRGLA